MKSKLQKIILTLLFASMLNVSLLSASTINSIDKMIKESNDILAIDDILENAKVKKEMEEYYINELGENYKEILKRNEQSTENAEKIKNLFPSVNYRSSGKKELIYPNYVGGIYINKNDELVLQIVENKIPIKKSSSYDLYNKILNVDENIIIEYVDTPYSELEKITKTIDNYFANNNIDGQVKKIVDGKIEYVNTYNYGNVSAFYTDVINNKVIVELKNYNEEEINKFKNNIIDTPLITFIQGEKSNEFATTNYYPGSKVLSSCSVGYRAKDAYGSRTGLVTAAHCTAPNIPYINLGQVVAWNITGSVDGAFIVTNSDISVSNSILYVTGSTMSSTLSTSILSPTVGTRVSKSGMSSGLTSGTITSTNWSGTIGNYAHSGMVATNVYAKGGDSGGIVFASSNNATAGIVSGGDTGGGNLIYSPAQDINTSLVIKRY